MQELSLRSASQTAPHVQRPPQPADRAEMSAYACMHAARVRAIAHPNLPASSSVHASMTGRPSYRGSAPVDRRRSTQCRGHQTSRDRFDPQQTSAREWNRLIGSASTSYSWPPRTRTPGPLRTRAALRGRSIDPAGRRPRLYKPVRGWSISGTSPPRTPSSPTLTRSC